MVTGIALSLLFSDPLNLLAGGPRSALLYAPFKIGGVAINLLFLSKVGLYIALLVAISHLLQRVLLSRLFSHLRVSPGLKFALGRFTTYAFFAAGLFIGLQTLGVNLSSLVVFGGAVGVGVGLGLQNVVSNFVAGLILLIEQPIRIGDRIETGGTLGDVIRIGARSTWIRTNENVVIIVPNNTFIEKSVTNWTVNDPNVRVSVPVGVGYNSAPTQVQDLMLQAAGENADVLADPPPKVIFTDYGDNSLNFTLWVWTATRAHSPMILKSDLYFALFAVFTQHGIELPFPQRDLHLRSSDIALPFGGPGAAQQAGEPRASATAPGRQSDV